MVVIFACVNQILWWSGPHGYGPHGVTGHMGVDYVTSGADMSKPNLGACAFIKLVVCGHQIGVCIERLPFFSESLFKV